MRCSTSVRLVLDVAVTQGGYARVLPSRYSQTWGRPRPPLAVRYYARSRCAGRGCGVRVFDATVRIEKPPSFVAGSEWTEFAHDRVPARNCFPSLSGTSARRVGSRVSPHRRHAQPAHSAALPHCTGTPLKT